MSRACPSIVTTELPHHTPSTTNQFGSVYDITYIAADSGPHRFQRPSTSGYSRNANPLQLAPAIDMNRAVHGLGKGAGRPAPGLLSKTAHARSSCGPHSLGDEPFGVSEHHSSYQSPRGASAAPWRPARYAGADHGDGARMCIRGNGEWSPAKSSATPRMPIPPLRPQAPHSHNACALHCTGVPIDTDTTNGVYGKTAAEDSARARTALPMFMWGDTPRDRLYSNSVQKCPDPSLGIRQLPDDEYNPNRLSRPAAERCRITKRLEHEGWVKNRTIAQTSSVHQQLYPETDGLHRSRGVDAPCRLAARGGNSNKEMFGDVTMRVVIDPSNTKSSMTVSRLQERLDTRVSTEDRHAHRLGFSAFSTKFRANTAR